MKTNLTGRWLAGGLALAMPWFHGLAQEAASAAGAVRTNTVPATAPADALTLTNVPEGAAEVVATNFPVLPDPLDQPRPVVPDPVAAQERPLPPGLQTTPSYREIVRMTSAGVDPRVMLSFITNSAGTFNMGADQIIYLKDLGLSHEVIAQMIEHDLAISSGAFPVRASTVPTRTSPAVSAAFETAGAAASAPATPPPSVGTAAVQPSVWEPQPTDPNTVAPVYAPAPAGEPPPPEGQSAETVPPAPQPTTVVNNNFFNETLSPYGNWVEVEGYGRVWQPNVTVINPTWRPYMDGGRWLYTDAGWYWNSDYAWGCTFQYGRWFFQPTFGWCWWPNTVWGPSWVTWRSSPGFCGWAPLPPFTCWTTGVGLTWFGRGVSAGFGFNFGHGHFNWVTIGGFCSPTPFLHCVPRGNTTVIYDQSVVVNNVIIGDNNTIINRGLDVDRVGRYAGRAVPRAELRDVPVTAGAHGRSDRVSRTGDQVVIERPISAVGRGPLTSPTRAAALASSSAAPVDAGVAARTLPPRSRPSAAASSTSPVGNAINTPPAASRALTATPAPSATAIRRTSADTSATATSPGGNIVRPPRATATAVTAPPARTTTPTQAPLVVRSAQAPATATTVNPPTRSQTQVTTIGGGNTPRPPSRAVAPSPVAISGNYAPSPVATRPAVTAPRAVSPTPQPRQVAPVTPRSYTSPTPAPAPAYRPSYSAPPVASRPSFTPSTPSYSSGGTPSARPSYTAPSYSPPSRSVPSAPAPAVARSTPAPSSDSRSSRAAGR